MNAVVKVIQWTLALGPALALAKMRKGHHRAEALAATIDWDEE